MAEYIVTRGILRFNREGVLLSAGSEIQHIWWVYHDSRLPQRNLLLRDDTSSRKDPILRGNIARPQRRTPTPFPAPASQPSEILSPGHQRPKKLHVAFYAVGKRHSQIKRRNLLCYDVMLRCDHEASGQHGNTIFSLLPRSMHLFLAHDEVHTKMQRRDAQIWQIMHLSTPDRHHPASRCIGGRASSGNFQGICEIMDFGCYDFNMFCFLLLLSDFFFDLQKMPSLHYSHVCMYTRIGSILTGHGSGPSRHSPKKPETPSSSSWGKGRLPASSSTPHSLLFQRRELVWSPPPFHSGSIH